MFFLSIVVVLVWVFLLLRGFFGDRLVCYVRRFSQREVFEDLGFGQLIDQCLEKFYFGDQYLGYGFLRVYNENRKGNLLQNILIVFFVVLFFICVDILGFCIYVVVLGLFWKQGKKKLLFYILGMLVGIIIVVGFYFIFWIDFVFWQMKQIFLKFQKSLDKFSKSILDYLKL